MTRAHKFAWIGGALAGSLRLVSGLILMWAARVSPELHLVVLIDLPTILTYFVLYLIGRPHNIGDASDGLFLFIGVATWFLWGMLIGAAAVWITEGRRSR